MWPRGAIEIYLLWRPAPVWQVMAVLNGSVRWKIAQFFVPILFLFALQIISVCRTKRSKWPMNWQIGNARHTLGGLLGCWLLSNVQTTASILQWGIWAIAADYNFLFRYFVISRVLSCLCDFFFFLVFILFFSPGGIYWRKKEQQSK